MYIQLKFNIILPFCVVAIKIKFEMFEKYYQQIPPFFSAPLKLKMNIGSPTFLCCSKHNQYQNV